MLTEPIAQPQSKTAISPIAVGGVIFDPGNDVDSLLLGVAQSLRQKGWVVAGLVQEETPRNTASCCPATFVRHLTDDTRTRISVDRGENATGCRLDAYALTEAAKRVDTALEAGAQILMINRFGQSESDGWGLRGTIELGIELGLPIIVGVRRTYVAPWHEFHGGLATSLAFDGNAIANWALTAVNRENSS